MNTITEKQIEDIIEAGNVEVSEMGDKTTVVRFTSKEGFEIIETSSCVDKANYKRSVGQSICMNKIKDKLWAYEGYCLQKDLYYDEIISEDYTLTARERVERELDDLKQKVYALQNLLDEPILDFSKLNAAEHYLLIRQEQLMRDYVKILTCRLSIWRDIE